MIGLKSLIIGLAAFFGATIGYLAVLLISRANRGGEPRIDLPAVLSHPVHLSFAITSFVVGFYWARIFFKKNR